MQVQKQGIPKKRKGIVAFFVFFEKIFFWFLYFSSEHTVSSEDDSESPLMEIQDIQKKRKGIACNFFVSKFIFAQILLGLQREEATRSVPGKMSNLRSWGLHPQRYALFLTHLFLFFIEDFLIGLSTMGLPAAEHSIASSIILSCRHCDNCQKCHAWVSPPQGRLPWFAESKTNNSITTR